DRHTVLQRRHVQSVERVTAILQPDSQPFAVAAMLLSFCSLTPRWLLFFHLAIWGSLLSAAAAVKLITEETAPAGLSPSCLEALTADVPCSLYVPRFRAGFFYSEKILNEACTADCRAGLLAYEASVVSACSDDTWEGYDDDDERGEQLGTIPSLLRYF